MKPAIGSTLLLLALVTAACRQPTEEPVTSARAPTVESERGGNASGAPLDRAEVTVRLEDEDALDRENAASYRQRRHSMAVYTECIAQADGLREAARQRVLDACDRLEDAPRR